MLFLFSALVVFTCIMMVPPLVAYLPVDANIQNILNATLQFSIFLSWPVIAFSMFNNRYIRSLSMSELESYIFTFHEAYFNVIGVDRAEVQDFKALLELRDLDAISRKWLKLRKEFIKFEREAGHKGRPLIMDYYDNYRYAVKRFENLNT